MRMASASDGASLGSSTISISLLAAVSAPIPEGIAVEMADCIIRILDWCGKEGIDIEAILEEKHAYNKTRPYRHGGKAL